MLFVVSLCIGLRISLLEWIAVAIVNSLPIGAEIINSAFEDIYDEQLRAQNNGNLVEDDKIKRHKELLTWFVTIYLLAAAIVDGVILLPKLWVFISP